MTAELSSESAQSSTAVQAPGPVTEGLAAARVNPPPPHKPLEQTGVRWLDGWSFGLIVLAALVGSSPPQNSDLWLHLASGRQVVAGGLAGADPFSYTVEGTRAINHSWLFDSVCYLCYRGLGGSALVALRVLLLVGLTLLVLFAVGRPARGQRGVPALCAALMLLTLARWLPLRSELASLFLLGLTLVLLLRLGRDRPSTLRDYLPFLFLFALWANLDSWFILGPLLLALHSIDQVSRRSGSPIVPLLAALGGFAACLVNPNLWHVWQVPVQLVLSPAAVVMSQDPIGTGMRITPLQGSFYRALVDLGPSAAGFVLLVLVGLFSFFRNPRAMLSWRFAVWLGLMFLGLYQMRIVGLFAVASAILARANLLDAPAAAEDHPAPWQRIARPVLAFGLLLLVVAAWPGWLQGRPYGARRWIAEPSASAQRLAGWLADRRDDGSLGPEARCFNFTPELANHLAWASPKNQSFLDGRLNLYSRETAEEYRVVRQAILDRADGKSPGEEWRKVLHKHKVRYLLLSDPDRRRRGAVFTALLEAPHDWALIRVAGEVAVFGWKDGDPERFREAERDLEREALIPVADQAAPEEGPKRDSRPRKWWEPFWRVARSESADREESMYHLTAFNVLRQREEANRVAVWEFALAGSAAGAPGGGLAPTSARLALQLNLLLISRGIRGNQASISLGQTWKRLFVFQVPPASMPLLLASIRAARRAISSDPDDALAWLFLGETYLILQAQESAFGASFTQLGQLRQAQASSAFHQALRRQPGMGLAHLRLVEYYQHINYTDLKLKHLRAYRQSVLEDREIATQLAHDLEDLEDVVAARVRAFNRDSGRLRVADRAQMAIRLGLAGKAIDLLLASDASAFGWEGANTELDLLLTTGEAREVDEMVDPEKAEVLGVRRYHWLRAQVALAQGDYEKADIAFAGMSDLVVKPPTQPRDFLHFQLSTRVTTAAWLSPPVQGGPGPLAFTAIAQAIILRNMSREIAEIERDSERMVLRGIAALEKGDASAAQRWFTVALKTYGSRELAVSGASMDFSGRPAAQQWLAALKASKRQADLSGQR